MKVSKEGLDNGHKVLSDWLDAAVNKVSDLVDANLEQVHVKVQQAIDGLLASAYAEQGYSDLSDFDGIEEEKPSHEVLEDMLKDIIADRGGKSMWSYITPTNMTAEAIVEAWRGVDKEKRTANWD